MSAADLQDVKLHMNWLLQGKKPVIVEMKDDLISADRRVSGEQLLSARMVRTGRRCRFILKPLLQSVEDGSDRLLKDKDGREIDHRRATRVISSAGYLPDPLAEESRQCTSGR